MRISREGRGGEKMTDFFNINVVLLLPKANSMFLKYSNKTLSYLDSFTLLCPKGPGYSVKNNTVDGT